MVLFIQTYPSFLIATIIIIRAAGAIFKQKMKGCLNNLSASPRPGSYADLITSSQAQSLEKIEWRIWAFEATVPCQGLAVSALTTCQTCFFSWFFSKPEP
jgi:hypothetical protein